MFHALGLAPVPPPAGLPLGTRRVVLLVPIAGLLLLHAVRQSELYLAVSGSVEGGFDHHFMSVHTAFVVVRRGNQRNNKNDHGGWQSLNDTLMVRDSTADDPEAELMTSALVPASVLMRAPPALTKLELRPRDSAETRNASEDVLNKLGGRFNTKVFHSADLDDVDQTAILAPGEACGAGEYVKDGVARLRLACPEAAETQRPNSNGAAIMHDGIAVDQSVELINEEGDRPLYRVHLVMESPEARQRLAEGRAPVIDKTLEPCTVRVQLGERVSHATSFPFPVRRSSIKMKYSKLQGYVVFTVLPISAGDDSTPLFAWTASGVEGVGPRRLPSMLAWSPCPPLASMPRLDFKAEWANLKVNSWVGPFSPEPSEYINRLCCFHVDSRPWVMKGRHT